MDKITFAKIREIIGFYPEIKLAYLFGSQIRKERGPLSDYDFAIYLDEADPIKMRDIQFELHAKIAKVLGQDKVDVLVLNLTNSPLLRYNVIKDGKVIVERAPHKLLVEPKILNEYFDFQAELHKHNLTKAFQ